MAKNELTRITRSTSIRNARDVRRKNPTFHIYLSAYSRHRFIRYFAVSAIGFRFETIFGAMAECRHEIFFYAFIIHPGPQQGFDVQHAVVVEACFQNALGSNAYAVASATECPGPRGDNS